MRFKNTAQHALDFKLGGKHHTVAVDGEVEIDNEIAYAIKTRGLPLEPIKGSEAQPPTRKEPDVDAPPPEGTPARLWFDRALALRDEADQLGRSLADVRKAFEQHRDETAIFTARLRAALKIAPESSILDAVEALKIEAAKLRADLDTATKPAPKPPRGSGSPAPATPQST